MECTLAATASKSIFMAENMLFTIQNHSLFHGTNTFYWHKHFLMAPTLFHGKISSQETQMHKCTNLGTMLSCIRNGPLRIDVQRKHKIEFIGCYFTKESESEETAMLYADV